MLFCSFFYNKGFECLSEERLVSSSTRAHEIQEKICTGHYRQPLRFDWPGGCWRFVISFIQEILLQNNEDGKCPWPN